jgi:hypothetical protein
LEADQISGEFRQARVAVREPELEDDVLTLDVAEFTQRLSEGVVRRRLGGRRRRGRAEDADPRNAGSKRGAGGERHEEKHQCHDERRTAERHMRLPIYANTPRTSPLSA